MHPWSRPDPRRDFILSLGFAAQRGNSKMLRRGATSSSHLALQRSAATRRCCAMPTLGAWRTALEDVTLRARALRTGLTGRAALVAMHRDLFEAL